jgi:RNA recognition motif-containing protein
MSFTVFLGNLPVWVTADDIKSWLTSESLVADAVKVIRNPETQESKGFAFIESPNQEEMNSIIRRFDRAPLEDRLLRANPAQPPKSGAKPVVNKPPSAAFSADRPRRAFTPAASSSTAATHTTANPNATATVAGANAQVRNNVKSNANRRSNSSPARHSAFAEELAKAL